jgi:hypothetical protein
MNPFQLPEFSPQDVGQLRFVSCRRYRLGSTNDEGWYRGQCRFSGLARSWGEFYEIAGDLRLSECPQDWIEVGPGPDNPRHFLFYFRDQTFECDAVGWSFELLKAELGAAPNCGPAANSEVSKEPKSVT